MWSIKSVKGTTTLDFAITSKGSKDLIIFRIQIRNLVNKTKRLLEFSVDV